MYTPPLQLTYAADRFDLVAVIGDLAAMVPSIVLPYDLTSNKPLLRALAFDSMERRGRWGARESVS